MARGRAKREENRVGRWFWFGLLGLSGLGAGVWLFRRRRGRSSYS